ncbi:MAG: hypothetical protein IT535_08015 [Bauldia sp.]|nr:hypothetical protein [Bauldia sp.]
MHALSAASLILLAFTLGVGLALFSLPYASGQTEPGGQALALCAVTPGGCG